MVATMAMAAKVSKADFVAGTGGSGLFLLDTTISDGS